MPNDTQTGRELQNVELWALAAVQVRQLDFEIEDIEVL